MQISIVSLARKGCRWQNNARQITLKGMLLLYIRMPVKAAMWTDVLRSMLALACCYTSACSCCTVTTISVVAALCVHLM